MAEIKLFENKNYEGGHATLDSSSANLKAQGVNDAVSSVKVVSGTWQIYSDSDYNGINVTLSEFGGPLGDGNYPSPDCMGGKNDYYSSIKLVSSEG